MLVTVYVVLGVTVVVNLFIAAADLKPAGFVLANSAEVGTPPRLLPVLAFLKVAGAVGLIVGLLGVALDISVGVYLGLAAAVGLVLFFTLALAQHVRHRVFHNIAFPGVYWLLAVASLALLVGEVAG